MDEAWVAGELIEVSAGAASGRSALVLDGTHEATVLCEGLNDRGWRTFRSSAQLRHTRELDLVVIFGYRHILPKSVLDAATARMINLHISYLPYNRGAHPGFWCFYDGTPCGVTIHEVDEGLDTGPVLAQQLVDIDPWKTTFDEAYWRLRSSIESLFFDLLPSLEAGTALGRRQLGAGSSHRVAQLPGAFAGWGALIGPEIERLHALRSAEDERAQELISRIEQVRSSNNVNWMDILRLAFSTSPDRAKQILARINQDDGQIASLLSQLASENTSGDGES